MTRLVPPRILTAAALIAAIVVVSVAPVSLKLTMIGLVLLLCWREWLRMAGFNGTGARSAGIVLFAAALAVPIAYPPSPELSLGAMVLGVAWWALALVVLRRHYAAMGTASATVCGVLGMAPAWLAVLAVLDTGRADPAASSAGSRWRGGHRRLRLREAVGPAASGAGAEQRQDR